MINANWKMAFPFWLADKGLPVSEMRLLMFAREGLMAGNVAQMDGKVEEECEKGGYERSYKPG
jgi:hypothetical protein